MIQEKLLRYKKYIELQGYRPSTRKQMLKAAHRYETQEPESIRLSTATKQLHQYLLKHYIQYLTKIEKESHYLAAKRYKKEIPQIEILTEKDIRELDIRCRDLRDKVVLALLYNCGLRLSEAANINLKDLDFKSNLLSIKKTKTRKQRQVPINTTTAQLFTTYIEQERYRHKGNKLLQGIKGDLTTTGIYRIVNELTKTAQVNKRIYPHLLRHSIASHLLQRGMPIEHIKKFLGHSSLESTQRYTHLEVRHKV